MTVSMTSSFVGAFWQSGFPRIAAGIVIGFGLLTRSAELLVLCYNDVLLSEDGSAGVVRLRDTKAGARAGFHETVVVDDPGVLRALLLFVFCQPLGRDRNTVQAPEGSHRGLPQAGALRHRALPSAKRRGH